ncbi:CgeB family protein [Paenibacillus pasadenensis]|uniref:CgeB family protein n=1 Tax=Paenibacillus pasadenensis TaxID=217090 RepID=UPI00040C7F6F|nr:glycosyltransferase [Paenibacillus pasadenensis]
MKKNEHCRNIQVENNHRLMSLIKTQLDPRIIKSQHSLLKQSWTASSEDITIETELNTLVISKRNEDNRYLSYIEKNNSFRIYPKHKFPICPKDHLHVDFDLEASGDLEVSLIVIEYDEREKMNQVVMKANSRNNELKLKNNTKAIRCALKVTGKGTAKIKRLELNRKQPVIKDLFVQNTKPIKQNRHRIIESLKDLKVACILDEFSRTCFEKNVRLINLIPSMWKETLNSDIPDLLLVESAWKGYQGTWEYKIATYSNQDKTDLKELINWCNENGVPTAFWNKEDPIHFNKFLDTAKMFDYVFTTDQNMIIPYQNEVKHKRVFAMPFSADPSLHNPVKLPEGRKNRINFAGSYYSNRHQDRQNAMNILFKLACEYEFDIYDRNFEANLKNKNSNFQFPDFLKDRIIGSLSYEDIEKAYKGYRICLNVNSVIDSPTMFSRRVFESLASGTPVVSTKSNGIQAMFNNLVINSNEIHVLEEEMNLLMNNDLYYRRKSLEGIREVYLNHTYQHRIHDLIKKIGIQVEHPSTENHISMVSVVHSKEEFERVHVIFSKQTFGNRKLYVFLDNFEGYIDIINHYNSNEVSAYVYSYAEYYEKASSFFGDTYVCYINPRDHYGENYLLDMAIAVEYSKSEIIGKNNKYCFENNEFIENKGEEYVFVTSLEPHSSMIKASLLKNNLFKCLLDLKENKNFNRYFPQGHKMFSVDKFNYVQNFISKQPVIYDL